VPFYDPKSTGRREALEKEALDKEALDKEALEKGE